MCPAHPHGAKGAGDGDHHSPSQEFAWASGAVMTHWARSRVLQPWESEVPVSLPVPGQIQRRAWPLPSPSSDLHAPASSHHLPLPNPIPRSCWEYFSHLLHVQEALPGSPGALKSKMLGAGYVEEEGGGGHSGEESPPPPRPPGFCRPRAAWWRHIPTPARVTCLLPLR